MGQSADSGNSAIRSSIDGLTKVTASAPGEVDDVGVSIRTAMEHITRINTDGLPRDEAGAVEAALHDITGDMLRTIDDLQRDVVTAIETQAAELEALLRPDTGTADDVPGHTEEPPPLPPMDDIEDPRGSDEWAAEVVRRYPRLTVDEVLAIHHYTTVRGVEEMNGHLRRPDDTPEADRAAIQKRIDAAASGLAKLPKVPGITFRGTDLPDHVLPNWRQGARVRDPAFISSSVDDGVAESFRRGGNAFITITGRSGVDVQQLSYFGAEAEILFLPSTQFRVVDVAWDDEQMCWRFRIVEAT